MKGVEQLEHTLHNLASPKRGHTFWGLLGVLAITGLLLLWIHREWIASPNEVMLITGQEGFKNYMTAAWHVRHDSSYVHYTGMAYPYGEHVLFTDNQPVISAAMQWWSRHMSDLNDQVVGIINLVQLISILFGAGIIYLLLRKLHLAVWYAGIAAIGIAFLSPQQNRFYGEFGLSHIWVFPMLLLLLCRYEERHSRRYQSLLIGLLIWFAAQIHFYYFGISAVFLGFYTLFQIAVKRSWRSIWTRFSHLMVMVLVPYTLLNVWLHWSDYSTKRPANPTGFTENIGHWEGVFLPYEYFPLFHWVNEHLFNIRYLDIEAQTYAGFLALVFTLWLVFKRGFRLFEADWETAAYHRVHKYYLKGIGFAGFACLLYGLGMPFALKGMQGAIQYLGPFRQFRDLGRFVWVFYYSIYVLIFYILWNKSRHLSINEKWLDWLKTHARKLAGAWPLLVKWGLIFIPLSVLIWEAAYFQGHKPAAHITNPLKKSEGPAQPDYWLNQVDFARFQALMPLPYYHIGSENVWLNVDYPLFQKVSLAAISSGAPDLGVNLSRTPVDKMCNALQFAFYPCETPAMLSEFPDSRPIALMVEPEKWKEVKKKYPHLLEKATKVFENPELKVFALIPDSLRAWTEQNVRRETHRMENAVLYPTDSHWRSVVPGKWFAYFSFDSLTASRYRFQGQGAAESRLGDTTWIWKNPIPKGNYQLSFWVKADEDMGLSPSFQFIETQNGETLQYRNESVQFYLRSFVQGWALIEIPFDVLSDKGQIGIFLQKKYCKMPFWYDEVLIKNAGTSYYRREPGWLVHDNYWFKLPKE